MASSGAPLHNPAVILPWARRRILEDELKLQSDVGGPQHENRIGLEDALVQSDRFELRVRNRKKRNLPEALAQWHLPYSPPAHIPEEDKPCLNEDRLIGLAVVLDVLTSETESLHENPLILAELQGALSRSGELGGIDSAGRERLKDFAKGPAGKARQLLARRFFDAAQAELLPNAEEAAIHILPTHLQCTPESVAQTLSVLKEYAKVLRDEVKLRLSKPQQLNEYQA